MTVFIICAFCALIFGLLLRVESLEEDVRELKARMG